MGALPVGAPSQDEVPQCTAEPGACTVRALSGPRVVLERTTLKVRCGFSYHGPELGFMAAPSLVAREPVGRGCWWGAQQPTTPERHLGTHLLNSGSNSVGLSEIGPTGGFIHFSFPLRPARGCAKIRRHTVISLKPRGA